MEKCDKLSVNFANCGGKCVIKLVKSRKTKISRRADRREVLREFMKVWLSCPRLANESAMPTTKTYQCVHIFEGLHVFVLYEWRHGNAGQIGKADEALRWRGKEKEGSHMEVDWTVSK